jgi:hypothetical protein
MSKIEVVINVDRNFSKIKKRMDKKCTVDTNMIDHRMAKGVDDGVLPCNYSILQHAWDTNNTQWYELLIKFIHLKSLTSSLQFGISKFWKLVKKFQFWASHFDTHYWHETLPETQQAETCRCSKFWLFVKNICGTTDQNDIQKLCIMWWWFMNNGNENEKWWSSESRIKKDERRKRRESYLPWNC